MTMSRYDTKRVSGKGSPIEAYCMEMSTHPSKYCTIFPFLDHAIHFGLGESESERLSTRITRGDSFPGGFDTLQTLRSPLEACVASISDFCFDEEACQAKDTIGDGPREVVKV